MPAKARDLDIIIHSFTVRFIWFVRRQFDVRLPRDLQGSAHGSDGHRVANDVQHAQRTRASVRNVAVLLDGSHPTDHGSCGIR